ncbi:MAG: NAD(P)H-dependent oxidoreductase subunit E [Spirochaetes bacterium]|jgi:NADH-quinone oxidoreductase subunit E|nr:NAD(P)H-dependent oxidoreductase subunit E [Spirochaetota bacterium]
MFEKEVAGIELSAELNQFISEWKEKPGNLIMILHRVQEEYGYIPREVALELSRILDVPLAKIYGVVTFYHFFKLTKPGKHIIQVCMGTACYLKGGADLIRDLERLLGLPVNGTTDDGEFSLEAVRCIGCCGLAPVMTVDGEVFGKIKSDQLPGVIAKYKGN